MDFPIKITDFALEKLLAAREQDEEISKDSSIRLGIVGGGCAGWQNTLSFDDEIDPKEDLVIDFKYGDKSIKVIIDEFSQMYMSGTTLDYEQTDFAEGFRFGNPKVSKTCGCGKSVDF